jgi:hypothetical protein
MRSSAGVMGLIAVLLEAGCAASAPQVKPTMHEVPPSSAIVVGKFGALSRVGQGLFYELQALQVETKKKWKLPLSAGDGDGNSNSVPFFLELPPGLYLLTKWMYMTNSQEYSGENAGVLFDLAPGQITCIGAIYMGSRGIIPNTHGSSTHFRGGTVLRDECDALAAQLKTKAPLLPPPVKKLARGATEQRPAP